MAQIPANSRALYRIMTEKSVIGFGKYADMRVGDILKVDPSYIAWAYYTCSMVSFKTEILESLGCEPIQKPGTSEEALKRWYRKGLEGLTEEEIREKFFHFRMAGKKVARARLADANDATHFTKRQLQAANHGHIKLY